MNRAVSSMEFTKFVEWYINKNPERQIDFLIDPIKETFIVNYVGRFENLRNDLAKILQDLRLPSNYNLPHKTASTHREHQDYKKYYDNYSVSLVEEYFHKDLKLLGYSFEKFDENFS